MLTIQRAESDAALKEYAVELRLKKRQRAAPKWGKLYPIYEAAAYLGIADLVTLLAVNKEWRRKLFKRVYRVMLGRDGNNLSNRQRKAIWVALLSPVEFTYNKV